MIPVKEDKLRTVLETLIGTRAEGLLKFHDDHIQEILVAQGSSHNHQAWSGGYHDHLVHCFILAQDLFKLLKERIGKSQNVDNYDDKGKFDPRTIRFTLESAIVVLYLHDIEKIFKYGLRVNRYSERLKKNKEAWYLGILPYKYGVWLEEDELNALQYIHGEGDDYKSDQRVMNSLAGFCHSIDVLSARVLYQIRDISNGFNGF